MTEGEYALRIIKELILGCDQEVMWTRYNEANRDWSGPVRACINCSDTFHWASADCEDIQPEDIDDLIALCKEDEYNGALLWVCMKRDMPPMRAYINQELLGARRDGNIMDYDKPFIKALEEKFGADADLS